VLKPGAKLKKKSFNYIYNGIKIKIKILICLVNSVFSPSICFFLAALQ
jgi:hypothetical protein